MPGERLGIRRLCDDLPMIGGNEVEALGRPIEVRGRPPRVTVVVYQLTDWGGAEGSTVLFLQRLARSEFQTRVLVLTGTCEFATRAELEALGMEFIQVRSRWPGRARAVFAELWRNPPDLVHSTLFFADLFARLAAPLAGAPAMVSVVNMQYAPEALAVAPSPRRLWLVRVTDRFLGRHLTSAFHALTAATARYATVELCADPERTVVVGRGRELDRFLVDESHGRAVRAELGIAEGAPVLLNVARHEPQKGQNLLLDAFAELRQTHPDAVLLVAGREGNTTPELLAQADELGLGDSVRFLGLRGDVPELLSASTVFVSSARYEGFGGAVLEAMAAARPVVAFDIPPVREVLGGTGVLVPLGDVAAMAGAIGTVLEDPDLASTMGAGGLAEAHRRYSAARSAVRLIDLYRDVITDAGRFRRPWVTRVGAKLRRR